MMRMNFTQKEKKKYLKELSTIYYRSLAGKATEREMKIAKKFSPYLINKLKKDFPLENIDMEKEEQEAQAMWSRIAGRLHLDCALLPEAEASCSEEDYRRAYAEELKKTERNERKVSVHRPVWMGYAAAIALITILLGGSLYLYENSNKAMDGVVAEVKARYTATNSINSYTLEDGTVADMNRDSELKIAKSFGGETRPVTMEGQVFFHVAKNPKKPFIITTQGLNVTVRGTSFEVMSYEEIEDKQVTVSTGRVEVANSQSGELLAVLTPGMQLIYNSRTGKHELKNVNAADVTAWRTGKLVLHNASVAELRLRLRQYFDKVLVIEHDALREDSRITSTFNYEDVTIDNVMNRICALFGAKYKIENNRIVLSVNNI